METQVDRLRLLLGAAHVSEQPGQPSSTTSEQDAIKRPSVGRETDLECGELAPAPTTFVPIKAVSNFVRQCVPATQQAEVNPPQSRRWRGRSCRSTVSINFFAQGRIWQRSWDIFYIYDASPLPNAKPLLLLRLAAFERFLDVVKEKLHIRLRLPPDAVDLGFIINFSPHSWRPRYLGQSTSPEDMEQFKQSVPPPSFHPPGEQPLSADPEALAIFREHLRKLTASETLKKQATKERKKAERIEKQKNWMRLNKRVQRYLGLRATEPQGWAEPRVTQQIVSPSLPAPYPMDGAVVFVCVDIEAWERDHSIITEIGVTTLDTNDLKTMSPGKGGLNWMTAIRARHFRISEHKDKRNYRHVAGCPDDFRFGNSEWINLDDAASTLASCFKYPFSQPGEALANAPASATQRNLILVGHGVRSDISWMQQLGYNPFNLRNLHETVDTELMYRAYARDQVARSLGTVLSQLDIAGLSLHNAGNDAAYTMQAMIGLAVRDLARRQHKEQFGEEYQRRLDE